MNNNAEKKKNVLFTTYSFLYILPLGKWNILTKVWFLLSQLSPCHIFIALV